METVTRNGLTFKARIWRRQGDHPKVRPATPADLPQSSNPTRYGWLDNPGQGQVVIPGDVILEDQNGTVRVVCERVFRKNYEPTPSPQ